MSAAAKQIDIEYVDKLHPVYTVPKRIKIIVGGRGSTKSTGIADYAAAQMANGQLWCCAREHQNSIEESVHRTILSEIDRLGIPGFADTKTSINHHSGGRCFYRGLVRNITSLKSTLSGIDCLWIEEGEDLSDNTLRVLTASVRLDAKATQDKMAGKNVKMPEIIITMNRGSRMGAVAQKWLARAEPELERCGYYEDDLLMVVEMNYTDMPQDWFLMSGLEQERLDDYDKLPRAVYDHKWLGRYLDAVDNAIIKPEWVDAAIDAHKIEHLKKVFEPTGAVIASHDPSDTGEDAKGYAERHGSILRTVKENMKGEIDEGCDWATGLSIKNRADMFVWDGDGMGAGLKSQVKTAFEGKQINTEMFRGSLSGSAMDNAEKIYQAESSESSSEKTKYKDTFLNNRAQYATELADRLYNTYLCVVKGKYIDPDNMISIDSDGVENLVKLRTELCSVPAKDNPRGLIQIMNKKEMKSLGIDSPNMFDACMMTMIKPKAKKKSKPMNFTSEF